MLKAEEQWHQDFNFCLPRQQVLRPSGLKVQLNKKLVHFPIHQSCHTSPSPRPMTPLPTRPCPPVYKRLERREPPTTRLLVFLLFSSKKLQTKQHISTSCSRQNTHLRNCSAIPVHCYQDVRPVTQHFRSGRLEHTKLQRGNHSMVALKK